jgi:hypothetical protein
MAWNRVSSSPALRPLTYGNAGESYQDESDWYTSGGTFQNGNTAQAQWSNPPYLPALTPAQGVKIEGGLDATEGDRHMLTVDTNKCMLYETYVTTYDSGSVGYTVAGSAVWNLSAPVGNQRPEGWTSADAAGLPIYPGVLKYEEILAGSINHALRFTATNASRAYTFPASHYGSKSNTSVPHYGARFRLKASFDISRYSAPTQVLLVALKKYGLIFADQGSTAFITCDDVAFPDPMNAEMNQGTRRIEFNTTNFEMVKSRGPIVRGFTPSGPIPCDGSPVAAPTPKQAAAPKQASAPSGGQAAPSGGQVAPSGVQSGPSAKASTPTAKNSSSSISVSALVLLATVSTVLSLF